MKIIIRWLISALAIAVAAYIIPGVHIASITAVLVLAIILAVLNTFIRPIILLLTLPLSIMTLGLFALVVNTLLIMLAAAVVPGVSIASFWWALLFGVVLALVHAVLHRMEKAA